MDQQHSSLNGHYSALNHNVTYTGFDGQEVSATLQGHLHILHVRCRQMCNIVILQGVVTLSSKVQIGTISNWI